LIIMPKTIEEDLNKFRALIKLMRPQQYYKNLLIFISIIFSANIFEFSLYTPLFVGFVGLCAISSVNYIINDWHDIKLDQQHPEKMKRPLASGNISKIEALILLNFLLGITLITILILPVSPKNQFLYILLILTIFITSQAYSLFFKNLPFYDVTFIALNYIWRIVIGVIVIEVTLSPWLFILGYLFALFLALSKRKGDLTLLGETNAQKHKVVFSVYSHKLLDQFLVLMSGSILVAYSIYIVQSTIDFSRNLTDLTKFENPFLMVLSIPAVALILMRLMYLQMSGSKSSRNAELLFLDKHIIIISIVIGILTFTSLYWDQILSFLQLNL